MKNLWDLIHAYPAMFAILYVVTLLAIAIIATGIQSEISKREAAWAASEVTESESKVQVASLALEQTRLMCASYAAAHNHPMPEPGKGFTFPSPN